MTAVLLKLGPHDNLAGVSSDTGLGRGLKVNSEGLEGWLTAKLGCNGLGKSKAPPTCARAPRV